MALDLALLKQDPNARVVMTHETVGEFYGYQQDDFNLSGAAEFSNPFEQHLQGTDARIQSVFSAFGADMFHIKNKASSLHQWISSTRPQIPIVFTLVRWYRAQDPVTRSASKLIGATFPVDAGEEGGLLDAPGNYRSGDKTGCWVVSVGQYFRADQLVLRQCDVAFSKEKMEDGSPHHANISCMFEPIMIPTQNDIERWFRVK